MVNLANYRDMLRSKPNSNSPNQTDEQVMVEKVMLHPRGPENHPDWKTMLGSKTASQAFLKLAFGKKLTHEQKAAVEKVKERLQR